MKQRYYLLEFDGHTYPAELTEFVDVESALAELAIREPLEPIGGHTVLLIGESEEALRVTHPGYFEDPFDGVRRAAHQSARQLRQPAPTP
jgi:hypothetical protein